MSRIRKRWKSVLVVWVLLAIPAVAAIAYLIRPTYVAWALVEAIPGQWGILADQKMDVLGPTESYLCTQGEIIRSSEVLRAALADPGLKGLRMLAVEDPVASLRNAISSELLPRTNLLRVSVKGDTADEAMRLARAVMRAYEAYAGGNEAHRREETKRILREERERLTANLKRQQDDIAKLAQQHNVVSDEMFTALRENKLRIAEQTAGDLEQARIEKLRLQAQLNQLDQELVPASQPVSLPAEDFAWKEQWIQNDTLLKKLRDHIAEEEFALLSDGDNPARQKRKESLQARYGEKLKAVAAEADRRVAERRKAMLDDARRQVGERLAAADKLVATLQASYDALNRKVQEMSKTSLELQSLRTISDSTRRELDRVEARLREIEIESRRPSTIKIQTEPEISPEGVEDRRFMLVPAALAATLFMSMAIAWTRGGDSGRVCAKDDAASGALSDAVAKGSRP